MYQSCGHLLSVHKTDTITIHKSNKPKELINSMERTKEIEAVAKWLKKTHSPISVGTTTDVNIYWSYIKASKSEVSKNVFTRIMKSLGYERRSRRFTDVERMESFTGKAYIFTGIKPCPDCKSCATCGGSKFIESVSK